MFSSGKRLLPILSLLVTCLLAVQMLRLPPELIPLPENERELYAASPYAQQLDAYLKGQIALDVPVSKELLELQNPYDPAEREGTYYLWDRALYNGSYWCYFGPAPILLFYFQIYLLTGRIPNDPLACLLSALLGILAVFFVLREVEKNFCNRPIPSLVAFAIPSLAAGSGLLTAAAIADRYYIPVGTAVACLFFTLALILRAARARPPMRALCLALSALFATLTVLSRPSAALGLVAAAPILLPLFFGRRSSGSRLASLAAFAIPLALGAAAVMAYNFLRFDSPFSFGAEYQLTVSDISQNRLRAGWLLPSLDTYFMTTPELVAGIPNASLPHFYPTDGSYLYRDRIIGAAYFLPVPALLLSPLTRRPRLVFTALVSAAVAVGIAFFDFCMAGVNLRYLYDLLPMLLFAGTATLLVLASRHKSLAPLAAVALLSPILLLNGVIHTFV